MSLLGDFLRRVRWIGSAILEAEQAHDVRENGVICAQKLHVRDSHVALSLS